MEKFGDVLGEKKATFKYGQTWKLWPSPLSLSLYSTFKWVIDLANVPVFYLISLRTFSQSLNNVNICTALCDSCCTTCCIFSAQIALELSKIYSHTIFFVLNIWIFKNYPQKIVFCNVNLSNLGNVLQRNLRRNRARECIFRASGGIHFEKLTALHQPWCCLHGFKVCTRLPKKTLDTSLNSNRWLIENL